MQAPCRQSGGQCRPRPSSIAHGACASRAKRKLVTATARRAADYTDDELAAIIARASPPLIEAQAEPYAAVLTAEPLRCH